MEIKNNILDVSEDYDTLFIDMYGVMFDGITLFENTLETLETLIKSGKNIVIVSNTSQTADDAKFGYSQRGMLSGVHYTEVATSGSFLNYFIKNHFDEFANSLGISGNKATFKTLFVGYENVFENTPITKVEDYDDADFIYVGVPRLGHGAIRIDDLSENGQPVNIEDVISKDWMRLKSSDGYQGLAEFAMLLDACLKKNKTLLIANPDIFAHGSVDHSNEKVPIVTQGCIGAYYEKLGGKAVYFGKPYTGIFEYAKTLVPNAEKIAMVGDTPWTDVLGGNRSGLDTVMTLTGVPSEFLKKISNDMSIPEKIDYLLNRIALKMSEGSKEVIPTHIVRKFAK